MLLVAKELTWGPRKPILDETTHKIVGWRYGRWRPGKPAVPPSAEDPAGLPAIPPVPMEWPLDLAIAPPTLAATNPEDQRVLDDARAAATLDERTRQLEIERAKMREEVRAEILAGEREKLKAEVAAEMAAASKAHASPAKPATSKPVPAGS